jgi:hypothetical protein
MPELCERALRPLDGVGARQGNGPDVGEHLVALVAVAGSGGKDEDVARADFEALPARAAELDRCGSPDDPKDLVGDRVEVVEREDPVPPVWKPVIRCKQLLATGRVVCRLDLVIDQDGQGRVRNSAVVFEAMGLGLDPGSLRPPGGDQDQVRELDLTVSARRFANDIGDGVPGLPLNVLRMCRDHRADRRGHVSGELGVLVRGLELEGELELLDLDP